MIFADVATVVVKAGDGGNGMASFRREPYVDRGGPDGGDGGRGGNIVMRAERNLSTLSDYRNTRTLRAEPGGNGGPSNRHGKNGNDLIVKVPVGTVITEGATVLVDLHTEGMETIIARGGDGGFGNAHFTSSTRQAPNFAEKGEPGEQLEITLELKMIADVGLVGLPNAGKSTLLSVVSNARPEIADYPFTTLRPNLGVADIDDTSLLIADIPGLIEGASEGKGLGDDFLRHVERTAVLIHLIDVYSNDIAADYQTIVHELESYKNDLTKRPMLVALTKTEGVDQEIIDDQTQKIRTLDEHASIYVISAQAHRGIDDLLRAAAAAVADYRRAEAEADEAVETVVTLQAPQPNWLLHETDTGLRITGKKIEKFARRTDFANEEAVARLRDIMKKMGITRELTRRGVTAGTTIEFGRSGKYKLDF